MLVAIIEKIQERSPLVYVIVRSASCICPLQIARHQEISILKFTKLVDKLFSGHWLSAKIADEAKHQFDEFIDSVSHT